MEAKLKKIKRNQVIITGFAIMIAIAGYINYTGNISDIISIKSTSKTEEAAATSNPVDEVTNDILSNDAEPDEQSLTEPGSVVLTSGTGVSSGIISQAKLNREQIRAKNKESLMDIINNAALTETSKAEAVAKLSQITDNSEKEIAAELLLEAKGFEDVVVSMLDGNVDVVVNKTTLTDYEKAQIEDVVKRKELKTDKVRSSFKAVELDSFTIEEKIDYIHDMLEISPKVRFWDIFKEDTSKAEIVVTFMALLELIKTRKAEIKQEKIFGEITISRSNGCDNNEAL